MFLPNLTWGFLEMMGYVFTSGRTPEMARTECVPFLRRSIHRTKNKKGNKKLAAVHFLMWKSYREACGEDFCPMTWVSCRRIFWLRLPKDWKRKRRFWVSAYHIHVYSKWGNYPCSLIFPSASLLLAKQMFLTGYCSAVCKQLLPETFPGACSFLVHRCLSPEVLGSSCDPNSCTPYLQVSFLLSACLV